MFTMIGVGVKNITINFEYWSSHYLSYTMFYTSTCPITYFTPKNVKEGGNLRVPSLQEEHLHRTDKRLPKLV
jgi:hypothetical protein